MTVFRIDLVSIVFVLSVINLVAPLFILLHARLTRTDIPIGLFALAKLFQGLSWALRIVWFGNDDPLTAAASDLALLAGFALESALLVRFAQSAGRPGLGRTTLWRYAGAFAAVVATSWVATLAGDGARSSVIFVGFLGFLLYAAHRLFWAPGAGPFQRLLAGLYSLLPLAQAILYTVLGDEVALPGWATSPGAFLYYGLLITLQLVGSLGYLLMVKERDMAILQDQATHDPLTGVLNRRAFYGRAEGLVAAAGRRRAPMSVILADLDRFKHINDHLGHQAGDRALVRFCEVVGKTIRSGDLFARNGGDEFVLLLPDTEGPTALAVAERIRDLIATPADDPATPVFTVSLGVGSGTPRDSEALAQLMATTDAALYQAKQLGRNRVEFREELCAEPSH